MRPERYRVSRILDMRMAEIVDRLKNCASLALTVYQICPMVVHTKSIAQSKQAQAELENSQDCAN